MRNNDFEILRDLASQVVEIAYMPIQKVRRDLWRRHNSLLASRPMILVSINSWDVLSTEIITESVLQCTDEVLRSIEFQLRRAIVQNLIGDDTIIEPWVTVDAEYTINGWGPQINNILPEASTGAYKQNPPIKEPEDIAKLVLPHHRINEEQTEYKLHKVNDAIGDIIGVNLNRGPAYYGFQGDISFWLGQLVGMEAIMYYMYDRPEWLHQVIRFLQQGILQVHREADSTGDWNLSNHMNQAMPYAHELPDPCPNVKAPQNKLWGFFESQEFAMISPEMFGEYLLDYQKPIMERFGLIAYGCCEDLTKKIDMLKGIPNLRRIAVSPWANLGKCAQLIEDDYVLSWRPNPSTMVCSDWNPDLVRATITEGMAVCAGCVYDITLKDIQTVRNEQWRLAEWVNIVKEITQ